jgi:hypothetical protein
MTETEITMVQDVADTIAGASAGQPTESIQSNTRALIGTASGSSGAGQR